MTKADALSVPQDHLQSLSLKCEPFANDLDGRFFYGGTALMQRLDLLTHLTQFGDSVILVSGPPGSGKTTMLGRFAGQSNKQWRLCLINADEFGQFKQRLGDTLRISDGGDELQMLEQWASQTDNSQLLVIVVDNAEQLPHEAFEKLCTALNRPVAERVRLILFGTPEAQQTLKQSIEQKDLSCTTQLLEIPRLSEEETSSYLMYRLAVAGYSGESPFTATEVRGICKAADGRPADINLLAHEALLERQARVTSKQIKSKGGGLKGGARLWGPASLVVLGAATYLGWERLHPTTPTEVVTPQATLEIPLALPRPEDTKAVEPPVLPATSINQVPAAGESAAGVDTPDTAPPVATISDPQAAPGVADSPSPEPAIAEITADPVTAAAPRIDPAPARANNPLPADEAPPSTAPPPQEIAALAPENAQAAVKPAAREVATQPATPPTAGSKPHREAWLLRQAGNQFSLQLLGSRSEKSLLEFIRAHNLDTEKTAYYRGSFGDGEWFVLIYGVYPDKQSALKARDALPARIRADKPWPRSLESVHASIREAR